MVSASEGYFGALASDAQLQFAFLQRLGDRGEVVVFRQVAPRAHETLNVQMRIEPKENEMWSG